MVVPKLVMPAGGSQTMTVIQPAATATVSKSSKDDKKKKKKDKKSKKDRGDRPPPDGRILAAVSLRHGHD